MSFNCSIEKPTDFPKPAGRRFTKINRVYELWRSENRTPAGKSKVERPATVTAKSADFHKPAGHVSFNY